MDGLLVDSEPIRNHARVALADRVGKEWKKEDHFNVIGVSTDEWTQCMIEHLELDLTPAELQREIIDQIMVLYTEKIPFHPMR